MTRENKSELALVLPEASSSGVAVTSVGKSVAMKERDKAPYLRVLMSRCDLGVWEQVVQRAIDDAIAGDARTAHLARQWLSGYIIGKPREMIELATDQDSPLARVLSLVAQSLVSKSQSVVEGDSEQEG